MPNWCSNEVEINGSPESLAVFAQEIQSDEQGLSMERFIPTPAELLAEDAGTAWYQWRADNWGTKWDIGKEDLFADYDEEYITFSYPTAWSPNVEFWTFMSKKFPEVSIVHHYEEAGMCFKGVATYKAGEVKDNCIEW
jgi:hypothetical protein